MRVYLLVLAVMTMMSGSAFAAADIKPGAPTGSCCRVGGEEGSSQQVDHDGVLVWTCHLGSFAFHSSWEKGLLPYSLVESRLTGPVGTWSQWSDRDNPGGAGDYELIENEKDCKIPLLIECQTTDGIDWTQSGVVYHCDVTKGGYCVNREQTGRRCADFKVRYLCSNLGAPNT